MNHHYHYSGGPGYPRVQNTYVAGSPCHRPTWSGDFKDLMDKPWEERIKYCPDWLPTEECDCEED